MGEDRVLEHQPKDELRWKGYVHEDPRNRAWHFRTIQEVIERMNKDLGERPDQDYTIRGD
jgi:hypothetical protein